jgi:hypothetical protein
MLMNVVVGLIFVWKFTRITDEDFDCLKTGVRMFPYSLYCSEVRMHRILEQFGVRASLFRK